MENERNLGQTYRADVHRHQGTLRLPHATVVSDHCQDIGVSGGCIERPRVPDDTLKKDELSWNTYLKN